jgi:threonine dehydrogenase-like Zn-dependent dehydrogenase
VIAIMGSILPETMRAVVFNGPFEVEVVDKPVPKILETTDAILKVSGTALCGSDLVRDTQSNPIFISQKSALQLP